jgi:hypothetical protein
MYPSIQGACAQISSDSVKQSRAVTVRKALICMWGYQDEWANIEHNIAAGVPTKPAS